MNFWSELSDTVKGAIIFVVVLAILASAFGAIFYVGNVTLFEGQRQSAYQFKVAQEIADYCSAANPDDPFVAGTVATLKADRDGNPDRFHKLTPQLQLQANAVIDGDHVTACGK